MFPLYTGGAYAFSDRFKYFHSDIIMRRIEMGMDVLFL